MIRSTRVWLFALATFAPLAPLPALAQGLGIGGVSVGVSVDSSSGSDDSSGLVGNVTKDVVDSLGTVTAGDDEIVISQDAALQAVRDKSVLPLEEIIARARQHQDGDILDARLIALKGFLLYELKFLADNGDITALYFYAQSGNIVRIN